MFISISLQVVLKEALQKLNTMTGAFFSRLVAFETLVIKIPELELVLKKVAVNDLKRLVIEGGSAKFKLPDNFVSFEEGNIHIKVPIHYQFKGGRTQFYRSLLSLRA